MPPPLCHMPAPLCHMPAPLRSYACAFVSYASAFESYASAFVSHACAQMPSVVDPVWIRNQRGPWIRIRIWIHNPDPYPGEQKRPTNIEKLINFFFKSHGCSHLRAEGFSCSLDISKMQFWSKKMFSCIFFLQFLVITTLDSDWIQIRINLKCCILMSHTAPWILRVRCGSYSSASACCMAGPSSNLGSAPQRRPSTERKQRGDQEWQSTSIIYKILYVCSVNVK